MPLARLRPHSRSRTNGSCRNEISRRDVRKGFGLSGSPEGTSRNLITPSSRPRSWIASRTLTIDMVTVARRLLESRYTTTWAARRHCLLRAGSLSFGSQRAPRRLSRIRTSASCFETIWVSTSRAQTRREKAINCRRCELAIASLSISTLSFRSYIRLPSPSRPRLQMARCIPIRCVIGSITR